MNYKSLENKNQLFCWGIFVVSCIYLAFVMNFYRNPFVSEYTIEAGSQLNIQDLLKEDTKNPEFVDELDEEFLSTVGTYPIKVKTAYAQYEVTLNIIDTTAPTAKVSKKTMWIGDEITSDLFVSKIQDASPVTTSFLKEPDYTKYNNCIKRYKW
jgi:hypothetical protein